MCEGYYYCGMWVEKLIFHSYKSQKSIILIDLDIKTSMIAFQLYVGCKFASVQILKTSFAWPKIHLGCNFAPGVQICTWVQIAHMNESLDANLGSLLYGDVSVMKTTTDKA